MLPLSLDNNRLALSSLSNNESFVLLRSHQKFRIKYKKDSGKVFSIFIGEDSDGKLFSINENAHDTQQAQALQSQGSYRPGLLTQHSHHDHLTGKTSLQDEASKLWRYS